MTDSMAITGVLIAMQPLRTTGALRITVEVPKEMANEAHRRLGGFPDPATSRHVALAILNYEQMISDNPQIHTVASDR